MTDTPSPDDGKPYDLDLGGGHGVRWFTFFHEPEPRERAGGTWWHPPGPKAPDAVKAQGFCCGAFWIKPYEKRFVWTVEKKEPFTISPSLLCTLCGQHGYIREGRWVPC